MMRESADLGHLVPLGARSRDRTVTKEEALSALSGVSIPSGHL